MRIRWLGSALSELNDQMDFVARENPASALQIEQRVRAVANRLLIFKRMGRAGRVEGTRELPVAGTPDVIVYEIEGEQVTIVKMLLGAQEYPPGR